MGAEDNLPASLAHVVLSCVAGARMPGLFSLYQQYGMNMTFVVHGVVGAFHYQSGALNTDISPVFAATLRASRYLPLPFFMADIYNPKPLFKYSHLLSAAIPIAVAVSGHDDTLIGNIVIVGNIVSLAYYTFKTRYTWGFYTLGTSLVTYFCVPKMGVETERIIYPLGLALLDYSAFRLYVVHWFTNMMRRRRKRAQQSHQQQQNKKKKKKHD